MTKQTCNLCQKGKCDECVDVNCYCREEHDKQELEQSFTEIASNIVPNSEELKRIMRKTMIVSKGKKTFEQKILDKPITVLRPITLLDDGTKIILVYLPTRTQEIIEDEKSYPEFSNKAYFIQSKNDGTKRIISSSDKEILENYQVKILDSWYQSRWNVSDLDLWIESKEKINPHDLYGISFNTTKKYLDFENDYDYAYFVLWNIGTYFYELFDAYPYNDYTGTKRAGKSKSMEFQKLVCYNAIMSADFSGSAMFRIIEGTGATILLDETEQMGNKNNDTAQHIRTLIMQGFLKDQYAVRSEGKADSGFMPTTYNLFSPKSLAHINSFDDVLEDRCIQQLMRRSKNKEKLDSWPDEKRDSSFRQIRDLSYRLFLDYGHEIYDLQNESRGLLDVSGRELKLWTPIITLANFFEKHGVKGLISAIQQKTKISSEDRQFQDEESSYDLRVLRFIDEIGVKIPEDERKGNPEGWIPIGVLHNKLDITKIDYSINTEWFTSVKLSQTLQRLGFKKAHKQGGNSFLVTDSQILDVKERMGFVKPKKKEENQTTLEISSEGSEDSEGSEQVLEIKHESEANEGSEANETNPKPYT